MAEDKDREKEGSASAAEKPDGTSQAEPPPRPGKIVPRGSMVLNLTASLVLGLALAVMVNWVSSRQYIRSDWTKGGFRELSGKTIQVLKALDTDVEMVAFISKTSSLYPDLREVLDRYRAQSSSLEVEFVDPDLDPVRFKTLQKKYKVRSGMVDEYSEMSEQVVVVRSGESTKFVDVDDMTQIEYGEDFMSTGDAEIKGFKAEEALTSAILTVTGGEKLVICFLEGHGERESGGYDKEGIGTATEFLRRDNYGIETLDLRSKQAVPSSCSAAVVAGPERPWPKEDVAKLEAYLRNGGRALLFLEPIIEGDTVLPTGLEPLLEKAGIGTGDAVVVETDKNRLVVGGGVGIFVTIDYGKHPIVKPIDQFLSLWTIARPLTLLEGGEAQPAKLVMTSKDSWGERHIGESDSESGVSKDGDDMEGPVVLGIASQLPSSMLVPGASAGPAGKGGEDAALEKGKGRIVVYGDVHLLATGVVDDPTWVNRELFEGAVAWLTERESLIAIPPKAVEKYEASLTLRDITVILLWVLVTIPGLVVVLGVLVWVRRRR